jgi:hypothetical protein
MSTYYQECDSDTIEMAARLILKNHEEIRKADVSITYLFAANEEGPALVHAGWPAKAIVKINSLRDRVAGLKDVTICLDGGGDGWKEWTKQHRLAVLDHELHHIEVRKNKVGAFMYDDANRPKIRLRKHDFQFGGFHLMASRHGEHSGEVLAVRHVEEVWSQGVFNFAREVAGKE